MIAHLLRLVRVEENKGYIRSIHDVVIDPLSRIERQLGTLSVTFSCDAANMIAVLIRGRRNRCSPDDRRIFSEDGHDVACR
jgi:hypothetical protein